MIAINPDAHSKESIHNVRFGVYAARRGGLPREMCLNSKTIGDFAQWAASR
jgi:DNA polymerase (family 10)